MDRIKIFFRFGLVKMLRVFRLGCGGNLFGFFLRV